METKEVEKTDNVTVMDVSAFTDISQKLNFLAQGIKNHKDAETKDIYIECYEEKIENKTVKKIRFSTDILIWTEISPYSENILPVNISVNLFDLYNIIENINQKDDIFSFWIDKSDPKSPMLVVGTLYDEIEECYSIEVRLKINKYDFPKRVMPTTKDPLSKLVHSFELEHIDLYNLIKQLNVEHMTEGINIVFKDNHMYFQTDYNGFKTNMIIKKYQEQLFLKETNIFIPFYIFNLMCSTGEVKLGPIKFNLYEDNYFILETTDYSFAYKVEKNVEPFEIISSDLKDYFIAESKNMESVIKLLNGINKPAPISTVTIEKINDKLADISIEYKGRYSASAIMAMAIFTKDIIKVDSDLLQKIFTDTNVDAIKVSLIEEKDDIENKKLYIKNENDIFIKEMCYDHIQFNKYRQKLRKENENR